MTIGGWIVMILSVTFVVGLTAFCFYRVLTSPPRQSELDTQPIDAPSETSSPPVQQRQRGKTAG